MVRNLTRTAKVFLTTVFAVVITMPNALALNMKAIEKGEIDVKFVDPGQGQLKNVKAVGLIEAAPLKVWNILVDYANYQHFMPRVLQSTVQKQTQDYAEAYIKLDLPWPLTNTWYINSYKKDVAKYKIEWRMLKGSIKYNGGYWELKPYGKHTLATYFVQADPGIPFIPQWMIDTATKSTVPSIFEAIRKRVQ